MNMNKKPSEISGLMVDHYICIPGLHTRVAVWGGAVRPPSTSFLLSTLFNSQDCYPSRGKQAKQALDAL